MRKTVLVALTMFVAITLGARLALAQAGSAQDEEAIRKLHQSFAEAWTNHDATAMAKFWSEDGDFISPDGQFTSGRDRIENYLAEAHTGDFATAKLAITVKSIRFLKPDVAVVNAEDEISGGRDWFDKPMASQKAIATSVVVKKDGQWSTAAYRLFVPPPPPSED
ncbi:MAG: SgcJ/EcaC family oxidoreductase [Terriglobia bacterium]